MKINFNNNWFITIMGGLIVFILSVLLGWLIKYFKKTYQEKRGRKSGRYVASNLDNKKITFYISESSNDFENNIFRDFSDFLKNREIIHFRHEIDSENFKNECLKIFNQNSNPSIRIQFKPNPDELIVGYDKRGRWFQNAFKNIFLSPAIHQKSLLIHSRS